MTQSGPVRSNTIHDVINDFQELMTLRLSHVIVKLKPLRKTEQRNTPLTSGTSLSYATSSETSMVKSYFQKNSQWGY